MVELRQSAEIEWYAECGEEMREMLVELRATCIADCGRTEE